MLKVDQYTNKIMLTKGDSASLFVGVVDLLDEEYHVNEDDIISMTIRKDADDEDVILYLIASNDNYIIFNPDDTKNLKAGYYIYDIQLETSEGEVYTIIPESTFELMREVTR